jgi:hypothetical protein
MCRQIDPRLLLMTPLTAHQFPASNTLGSTNIESLGRENHAPSDLCPIRSVSRALYSLTHCCLEGFAMLSRYTFCNSNHRVQSKPLKS